MDKEIPDELLPKAEEMCVQLGIAVVGSREEFDKIPGSLPEIWRELLEVVKDQQVLQERLKRYLGVDEFFK